MLGVVFLIVEWVGLLWLIFVDVNGFKTDHRAASALQDCFTNFDDAVDEIRGSLKQMRQLGATGAGGVSFRFQMSNVQTWMSAGAGAGGVSSLSLSVARVAVIFHRKVNGSLV